MKAKFKRKSDTWWKDQKVITLIEVGNRLGSKPPGTIGTVRRKYSGLTIDMEPCEHCGISLSVSRVGYDHIALFDDYVFVEYEIARMRAGFQVSCTGERHYVILWEGKYLVLPEALVGKNLVRISGIQTYEDTIANEQ